MALDVAIATYGPGNAELQPMYNDEFAFTVDVNFGPNLTVAAGTVLGKVTSSANDVQTVAVTGSPTGGSYQLTLNLPGIAPTNVTVNQGATTSTIQASVNSAVGSGIVTVGGTDYSSFTMTGAGRLAGTPIAPATVAANNLTGGTSPAVTVTHTTTGATADTWAAYASGNSDGTQTARGLARFSVTTDANGRVSFGPGGTGDEWGGKELTAPVFISGYFATVDLVGLDSTAVSALGRLVDGDITNGVLHVS